MADQTTETPIQEPNADTAPQDEPIESPVDLSGRLATLQQQFDTVLPPLVAVLKREASVEELQQRLVRAEKESNAHRALPLAVAVMRALHNIRQTTVDPTARSIIEHELLAALAHQGFVEFDPLGEIFDPDRHTAVAADESVGPQRIVVEVYATGFTLGALIVVKAQVRAGPERLAPPAPSGAHDQLDIEGGPAW